MPEWSLNQIITALLTLAAFVAAGSLAYFILTRIAAKLAGRTTTSLDNLLLRAIEKPVVLAIIIFGLNLALKTLPLSGRVSTIQHAVVQGFTAALTMYAAHAVAEALLKWYAQEIAGTTKTSLDDKMIPVLRKVILLSALLLGALWILDVVGVDLPWLRNWLVQTGTRVGLILFLSMFLIFLTGRIIPAAVRPAVMQKAKDQPEEEIRKRVDTLSGVFVSAAEVVIILMASFMLLSELGLDIAPLLAGAGVAGVAIGFGAQSLIKDILNGLFVILENQYRIGDVVKIADISGQVEDISLRRTILRDMDGIVHSIPNGEIRVASNYTREYSRANLDISVGYGEDLDSVIAVVNKVGKELAEDPAWAPRIIKAPQFLRVENLGDSGIAMKIVGDTRPMEQWNVMGELRKRLKKAFDTEGIEIPWPHTKVYFGNSPETTSQPGHSKGKTEESRPK